MYDDSYYTTTSAPDGAMLAMLGGFVLVVLLLAVASYVLTALGLMKFFAKAGKPAWAAWVPVYNVYVMAEVAKSESYWFWIYVGGIVVSFIPVLNALSIASLVAVIFITYQFLARFGKDAGHTALAVLFPFAYYPIVGFSKDLKFTGTKAAEVPKQS